MADKGRMGSDDDRTCDLGARYTIEPLWCEAVEDLDEAERLLRELKDAAIGYICKGRDGSVQNKRLQAAFDRVDAFLAGSGGEVETAEPRSAADAQQTPPVNSGVQDHSDLSRCDDSTADRAWNDPAPRPPAKLTSAQEWAERIHSGVRSAGRYTKGVSVYESAERIITAAQSEAKRYWLERAIEAASPMESVGLAIDAIRQLAAEGEDDDT